MRTSLMLAVLLSMIVAHVEAGPTTAQPRGIPLWQESHRGELNRTPDHSASVEAYNAAFARRDYREALRIANRTIMNFPTSSAAVVMQKRAEAAVEGFLPIPIPTPPAARRAGLTLDVF